MIPSLAFLGVSALVIAAPGPDTAVTVSAPMPRHRRSVDHGRWELIGERLTCESTPGEPLGESTYGGSPSGSPSGSPQGCRCPTTNKIIFGAGGRCSVSRPRFASMEWTAGQGRLSPG
ncbi:hypothetical protein GCM10009727_12550 [Actinomadura napierensis]|uniref:Ig-like domain-containing protein n=1 Tax=Actinomadura napierensis TaxID=267854 RepID=A0ABP5K0M1_9ACTN